ncbi:MAG: flagellar basal-body rod protein FlgF [Rhizobiales bacterium]|nr:flagellar basal-body rod protein FlgF [Hyphomicrobiales bacterium]
MPVNLDVALSAQLALIKRMDSIANNVANSSTVGFRADEISFESLISQQTSQPTAFATSGRTHISRNSGALISTNNPLDVAVQGDAWLAFQSPNGVAYTRDGRMQMLETGELQTVNGHSILDAGGAPLVLNPGSGPPQIARDGMITQNNQQVGAIGLFSLPQNAQLSRFENSGVVPNLPAEPILDFTANGVAQGFIEQSNVNPVKQMTDLIAVSRTFESLASAISDTESTLQNAIRTLGESS